MFYHIEGKNPKQTRYASNLNASGQSVSMSDHRPNYFPMMPWLFLSHCSIASVIWFKGKRYFPYRPTLGDKQAERGAETVSAFSEHISTKLFSTGDCVILIHWESSWGSQALIPPLRYTSPFLIVRTLIKQHACRHTNQFRFWRWDILLRYSSRYFHLLLNSLSLHFRKGLNNIGIKGAGGNYMLLQKLWEGWLENTA